MTMIAARVIPGVAMPPVAGLAPSLNVAGRRLKVAHVVRQFRPAVGGMEESVHRLCKVLAEHVDVDVVTLDRLFTDKERRLPAHDVVDGLPVTRLPWSGSSRYPIAPGVWRAIRDADIVHVHGVDYFFDALAATRWLHGKPLIASTHGGFFHTRFAARAKKAYFASVTRASCRAYDAICASGESDYDLFARISPRVHRIANGVESGKWGGLASRTPERTLIYFGRISSNKRVDLAVGLLARLLAVEEGWRLIIAGTPWDVTEDELRAAIARHGVEHAVDVVLAPDDARIGELIARSSFYVSASGHEGFGISVVEAMGAGLLPVLSRIPAFEALVGAAGEGLLIADMASEQAARDVIEAFGRLQRDGDALRGHLLRSASGYDWRERAGEILDLYRAAAAGLRR
jgi:alpha-1,3-mannosyltransferase